MHLSLLFIIRHNLFLHSSLVVSRKISPSPKGFKVSDHYHKKSLSMISTLQLKLNLESKKVTQYVNKSIHNFEVDVLCTKNNKTKIMQ
jgi:hypothetical protein